MLWLALYFPQLPLEVATRGRQQAGALAVVEAVEGRDHIGRCNAAAATYGICPGMALPAALALCDRLDVYRRDRVRERQALHDLASWAYQFSARISPEPSLLLVEVGASRRLFGGLPKLLAQVRHELGQLGYSARHALAPTATAAGLLARCNGGCEVSTIDDLAGVVRPLPLAQLTRDPKARALIGRIGLNTIGDAVDLQRAELARRLGPQLPALLDRLLGQEPDPRADWVPPQHFAQTLELLGEIGQTTALVFPARRLIVALCGFLRGSDGATQRLQWTLHHRDRPLTVFAQGLLDPSRDPDHILELFRERIERLELPAPVVSLALRVDDWRPFAAQATDLLGRVGPVDRQLVERLGNRLGGRQVRGLRCRPDHRPELAWHLCAPGDADGAQLAPLPHGRSQPPWLLPLPRPLREREGVPQYGGPLRLQRPPERIEGGWWDGFDITRDYFVAYSPAGECLWVFHDRRGGGWYLHGLFM